MCRNCIRSADGKRLTNYPDPADMRGAEFQALTVDPASMQDMLDLLALSRELAPNLEKIVCLSLGTPKERLWPGESYSSLMASMTDFERRFLGSYGLSQP